MSTPVLYTQTGCADSARVRAWLQQHGIAVVERNVTDDPAVMRELAGFAVFATPLLVVDGRRLLGYRPAELAAVFAAPDRRGGEPDRGCSPSRWC